MTTTLHLDVRALSQAMQPLVQAMLWGTMAAAVIMPVAGAVGSVVSQKIEKKWGEPTLRKGK